MNRRNRLENAKFPVITLLIRELLGGEWFASDCVIRQGVHCEPIPGSGVISWSEPRRRCAETRLSWFSARGLRRGLTHRIRTMGNPRSSDRVTLTVAERVRRAPHRLDPARKPGSLGRVRRSALASRSEELRFLLQSGPNASLIAQECAGFSALTELRPHRGHLNSGWAASPICQGLGFD